MFFKEKSNFKKFLKFDFCGALWYTINKGGNTDE